MLSSESSSIEDFCVVGINYKNADTSLRGKYAVQDEQYEEILRAAAAENINEVFVLSTCNRTEIYGCVPKMEQLEDLICRHTSGAESYFSEHAYRKSGRDAIAHIFNVAAGLDSQILGDYEIVGQLKRAIAFAEEHDRIGLFTDRLFKNVLQSCRAIRAKTNLSSGTVSVAYAAVLFLQEQLETTSKANILVVGLGKIGRNACKNLLAAFPGCSITLINRTEEKAAALAKELGESVSVIPFNQLGQAVQGSEVIIVATNAASPVLTEKDFPGRTQKILIDLSVPNNIDPALGLQENIILANVDDLSKINDRTLKRREAEIPAAKAFITQYIHQFAEWYLMRRNVPVLKAVKQKLSTLNHDLTDAEEAEDNGLMQKVINDMAAKMRKEGRPSGCYYIEALNGYINEVSSETR